MQRTFTPRTAIRATASAVRYGCCRRTLEVFARETQEIVEGKRVGAPYHSFAGDGLCVEFEIGGMAYDPNRIG